MIKFVAIVDHKAGHAPGFSHKELSAKTATAAMAEAETLMDSTAYMVRIAQKSGPSVWSEGARRAPYVEILANRGNGWHNCDAEHGENPQTWERQDYRAFTCYDLKH